MAQIDDKVMSAVEAALKDNPSASVDELFEIARGINPEMGELSKRQFHARYPLQVKRKMNPGKRRRRRRVKTTAQGGARGHGAGASREAVRAVFLKFATELAGAEERKDVVRVVANVDSYVDEVLEVTAKK
jgi:hypothetical protein